MQILPNSPSPASEANLNGVYQVNPAAAVGQQYNMTLYDVLNFGYSLGLDAYAIWDEERRQPLNDCIVNHFMFREIAGETPRQFLWFLNTTMAETMPGLNPIFELVEKSTYEDLARSEHVKGTRSSTGANETKGTQNAYTSTNPKETMIGKDPTAYYNAGQFSDTGGSGTNTYEESYESTRNGIPLVQAMQIWAAGPTNPLEVLFTALEPCFRQLVRPNFNIW